jgi:predicted HicB family RNase H-like nuclease
MMKHKGYSGEAWVDLDAGVIRGRIVGLKDVITFQGATVEEARAAFVESVDDYLAFCAERGEKPEKPFSGKILVRLDPETHRALSMAAEREGKSLNSLVASQLKMGCLDDVGATFSREVTLGKKRSSAAKAGKRGKSLGDKETGPAK